ncbi:MotA/TolQ/ExbB proton channel family protein [Pelobacter seleniigenes]|uniref:MotA/TolQ/ExbB proton channel family protein n=1 Tax=Pelobacter seleniigenes TaxID=407188 RepID=UPI0004A6DB26|nr:MotA/TolQ/ExbB proton channel family protein [Pelobacter seleniigenes]
MSAWFTETLLPLENYLASGGITMIPLLAVCLLMWFLIIDRVLFFRRLQRRKMPLAEALVHIRENRLPTVRDGQGLSAVLVGEFITRRKNPAEDGPLLDALVAKHSRRVTACLPLIGVLATVAPLLGLLGTVTGMMTTFDVLALFGTGNARALASGISEALITTQSGLLIAIPGLYMKGFLERRAGTLQQRLTLFGYCLKRHLH